MRRYLIDLHPADPDFPGECLDDDPECPCVPDPERDQDTLTDGLARIDGKELDDGDENNDLTPFKVVKDGSVYKVRAGSHAQATASLSGDGLSFFDGASEERMIEWGHHSSGSRWHTHRVSFDGGDLVTVASDA